MRGYHVFAASVAVLLSFVVSAQQPQQQQQCGPPVVPLQAAPKSSYRVGVLANKGIENAMRDHNLTFAAYLTASAGRMFDPPVSFDMIPVPFTGVIDEYETGGYDFVHANPSVYSCVASEMGASSLVSKVALRKVDGKEYRFSKFGGVIFTLANRSDINTMEDIKGKRAACVSIEGLGSGQMQFRELEAIGLAYLQDVKQMLFTTNQNSIVNAVLQGHVDVGYVRTDQLDRYKDPATGGELLDLSRVKIINLQEGLETDGQPFPFASSTPLYPEWNVAALSHVSNAVALAVQSSLIAMKGHAALRPGLETCYGVMNCTTSDCRDECFRALQVINPSQHGCDTTRELVHLASDALTAGKYSGYRSSLSYMELRNMQEETGFIRKDPETGNFRCVRSTELADAVVCPAGHFKKTNEEIDRGCEDAGLDCYGFQCLCSPCVKAFDVEFQPYYYYRDDDGDYSDHHADSSLTSSRNTSSSLDTQQRRGCSKFSICGTVEQGHTITFRAVDNKNRVNATFAATVLIGDATDTFPMHRLGEGDSNSSSSSQEEEESTSLFAYEFTFNATELPVGVVIIQVFANEEQIPESPFRLQVAARDCAADTGNSFLEPDALGNCVCQGGTLKVGSNCVPMSVLLPSILLPTALIVALLVWWYVDTKRKQADSVWQVNPGDLIFSDPPHILGRGSFGLVLLAEYRGTHVAVKRVLPPKDSAISKKQRHAKKNKGHHNGSTDLEVDVDDVDKREQHDIEEGRAAGAGGVDSWAGDNADHPQEKHVSFGVPADDASSGLNHKSVKFNLDQVRKATPKDGRKSHFDFYEKSGVYNGSMGAFSKSRKQRLFYLTSKPLQFASQKSSKTATSLGKRLSMSIRSILHLPSTGGSSYSRLKQDFVDEMRLISKLRHPCITTVMGAVISRWSEPMLVMEYMELGSLYDLLHNNSLILEDETILHILRDVASGLRFLHAASIVHGDIKSGNVLVDSKFRSKVADFGLSQKKNFRQSATGTPLWMAPELLRGETTNTPSSDIYAFGIVLYEVFSRKDPYEGEDPEQVLRDVKDPSVGKRPPVPLTCPQEMANLMRACFVEAPDDRPTAEEIDHRFKMLDAQNVDPGNPILSMQTRKSKVAERTEALLLDLFPKHVATALRDGRKVEPESFECVTVFFSDIVGYTNISSHLSPEKVSCLLDRLYTVFDKLCGIHKVFKVETVGDAYMGVTNLAMRQPDHARIMAAFALDAVEAAGRVLIDRENPALGTVSIRAGMHSGPIVAHVVGTKVPRYSIIGDSVNTASRMESHSLPGRVQISEASAKLLAEQDPDVNVVPRGKVAIKGKGDMETFWVVGSGESISSEQTYQDAEHSANHQQDSIAEDASSTQRESESVESAAFIASTMRNARLVDTNVQILLRLLKQIVSHRNAGLSVAAGNDDQRQHQQQQPRLERQSSSSSTSPSSGNSSSIFEEVKEVIVLPEFNAEVARARQPWEQAIIPKKVVTQLREYVLTISHLYQNNAFHGFEHATHVIKSTAKMLSNIIAPTEVDEEASNQVAHETSHGISSDPLTQFAIVFSALIHDVDHPGVPNSQLIKEDAKIAAHYGNRSVAEQNSIEISLNLLMEDTYTDLRETIYSTEDERMRFRSLVVNAVMATDIMDKELKELRNGRWDKAFSEHSPSEHDHPRDNVNRRATIVIEHLIQASDVAHTMQHWSVYRKWNQLFFEECFKAFMEGRAEKNPADNWYKGEIGFFDFYIIPLARKLKDCGIFGIEGDKHLINAHKNRKRWEEQGKEIVAEMIQNLQHDH